MDSCSIDKWLGKRYQSDSYTCSDFTAEVWLDITGQDIASALNGLLRRHTSKLTREHARAFRALPEPVSPCMIVMQRPRCAVHIAVYLRGSILQITGNGVEFTPINIATRFYSSYRFIECIL